MEHGSHCVNEQVHPIPTTTIPSPTRNAKQCHTMLHQRLTSTPTPQLAASLGLDESWHGVDKNGVDEMVLDWGEAEMVADATVDDAAAVGGS